MGRRGEIPKEARADPQSLQQRRRKAVHHVPLAASEGTEGSRRPQQTSSQDSRRKSRVDKPTRLRAAFCSLPGYLGFGGRTISGIRRPPTGTVVRDRALPRHLLGPPQGSRPRPSPRPTRRPQSVLPLRPARFPGRKRPCPGCSTRHRARPALSPQGAHRTRRRAWAPWCRRHRRLPLSPASRRLAKQRLAAADAAAPARAAAAATSTSGRGSAHP